MPTTIQQEMIEKLQNINDVEKIENQIKYGELWLKALKARRDELTSTTKENIIYTHPCYDTSKHHAGKYKHWAKLLVAVDTNQKNGYAFTGDFLSCSRQNSVKDGSYIIEFSSCKKTDEQYVLKQITAEGEEELALGGWKYMIDFIKEVAEITGL